MKIECVQQKLVEAISKAEKITSKNPTLPVLRCILLEASKNTLTIKATNLELGIQVTIPAKVSQEGIVAVPAPVFYSFISQLQDETSITLEVKDKNLIVSSAAGTASINTYEHEDFPSIPTITEARTFTIGAQELVKGLKSVWYSASLASMKPELSSVFMYSDDDGVVFAATDSFRLAEKRVASKKAKDFGQILIPYKSVVEIIRIIDDSKEDIEVSLNKNQISFTFATTYVTSRIVDGSFPDYKQLIPKEFSSEVVVLKNDLISALKMANIFSDAFHAISLKVSPSKKLFELQTKNTAVGENIRSIAGALNGEDVAVNFNYKYIMDSFQSIDSDSVSLQFNGLNRPMVLRGVSDSSFTYLVMPMNK